MTQLLFINHSDEKLEKETNSSSKKRCVHAEIIMKKTLTGSYDFPVALATTVMKNQKTKQIQVTRKSMCIMNNNEKTDRYFFQTQLQDNHGTPSILDGTFLHIVIKYMMI